MKQTPFRTVAAELTALDAKINFDWNRVAPAADFPSKTFAVRWTGELVPPAPGDYVLVHAGMAIERLDEQSARETLELLKAAMEAGQPPREKT